MVVSVHNIKNILKFNIVDSSIFRAIECGNLEKVKKKYDPRISFLIDYASYYGQLEIIKWLHSKKSEKCTKNAMNWASKNGHLDIVKWLHSNRREYNIKTAIEFAERNGHFEIVNFLSSLNE